MAANVSDVDEFGSLIQQMAYLLSLYFHTGGRLCLQLPGPALAMTQGQISAQIGPIEPADSCKKTDLVVAAPYNVLLCATRQVQCVNWNV